MDWHRLFGLILIDLFTNSPYKVELEKDLSLKQQRLDVVIIRKEAGTFQGRLPDGLDNLADHNLISFKSYQEAFDAWTIKELIGHYVNYRKQTAPAKDELLPEEDFRLYGVSARYPTQLAAQVDLEELQPGVLQCRWGTDLVRILVLRDLPEEEHNAPLHLFSAVPEKIQYGQGHYHQHSPQTSGLIGQLLKYYSEEGFPMSYTMEDFRREVKKEFLETLTPEERLEIIQKASVQELLEGLSPQELAKFVQGIPIQERLQGLTREQVEKYLQELNGDSPESAE